MPRLPEHLRRPLTRRFQSTLALAAGRATVLGQFAWDELDGYDEDDIATFARRTSPTTTALKAAAVVAAVGYYAMLIGRPAPRLAPAAIPASPTLRDPFISVWQALKNGHSEMDAIAAGRTRVDAVMANLANSAARQTGDYVAQQSGERLLGWERITNAGACDWCELVAGQVYHSADSADFGHDRCGCTAAPLLV